MLQYEEDRNRSLCRVSLAPTIRKKSRRQLLFSTLINKLIEATIVLGSRRSRRVRSNLLRIFGEATSTRKIPKFSTSEQVLPLFVPIGKRKRPSTTSTCSYRYSIERSLEGEVVWSLGYWLAQGLDPLPHHKLLVVVPKVPVLGELPDSHHRYYHICVLHFGIVISLLCPRGE